MKPRAKPKPRDPLATRSALVDAAAAIFKREGYFATDSNAIAKRAGYAPGSFYNHFADKAAILLAVYERYVELEWQGVRAAALPNLPPTKARGRALRSPKGEAWGGGQTTVAPQNRIAAVLDFIETLHSEWARFRTDLRAVARLEPDVAKALTVSRAKQMDLLASLSGLSRAKHGPRLLIALALVERYADLLAEANILAISQSSIKRELGGYFVETLTANNRPVKIQN